MFYFGIEHEVAFLKEGIFVDFTNTTFEEMDQIIEVLPVYKNDYPALRIGDLKIKYKRWYIECYERFDEQGSLQECVPSGIEIRTTPSSSISGAVDELKKSFELLTTVAGDFGFTPTWISFNPYQSQAPIDPPFNSYEKKLNEESQSHATADITTLTYGPDLNISFSGSNDHDLIDIAKKLTYYSPFIIPFTFSSPFYEGKLWNGFSVRTFIRSQRRPSVVAYLKHKENLVSSKPWLTEEARLESENGRIEFKACDSCKDFTIYAGLLALFKGLILDTTLTGRRLTPDKKLHALSAHRGFLDEKIARQTENILDRATKALGNDPDVGYLDILKEMLGNRKMPAQDLIERYKKSKSIEVALKDNY